MEKVKKIIGLSPEEVSNIEELLVKEITQISQCTNTQHIVTFVLEHDKGDHRFPVLAQISNVGDTLWLNTEQLQNQRAKPINVTDLRVRCQKAFKASKVEDKIFEILDKRFSMVSCDARLYAKNELVKLFLEI